MNPLARRIPGGKGSAAEKDLETLRELYTSVMESERSIMEGFHSLISSAKDTRKALESPQSSEVATPTLVYWRDEDGEHSFMSNELQVG